MSAWSAAGAPRVRPARLVGLASVLVDVGVRLPHLPRRGGDVVAHDAGRAAGGGINALAAAARLGLRCAYAGPHGRGPNGEAVRSALAAERVAPLTLPDGDLDTGWCLAMIEPDGERTFITVPGAEARQSARRLAAVRTDDRDVVYVSGYDLAYPDAGPALAVWVTALPPAGPDGGPLVVLDPGPLAATVPAEVLRPVLDRTDLLTLSAAEAAAVGIGEDLDGPPGAAVVLRGGGSPVRLRVPGCPAGTVPAIAPPGGVVDTNGAGDVHTGALVAGLARGLDLRGAVTLANAAAAVSVTRAGANSGPTSAELARLLPGHTHG